jgi:hypothetical protein
MSIHSGEEMDTALHLADKLQKDKPSDMPSKMIPLPQGMEVDLVFYIQSEPGVLHPVR